MPTPLRRTVAVIAGCLGAIGIALIAALLARELWPAYAAAEPAKAYTQAMLVARLVVAALCTAGGACLTTAVARDNGLAAWWLGGILLAISVPMHLFRVWADYPIWYHAVYLASLLPVAGLTGRALSLSRPWPATPPAI